MSVKERSDPFWFDDPSILWHPDRVLEFFPGNRQTFPEKFNSLTRFGIIGAVALGIGRRTLRFALMMLALMVIVFLGSKHAEASWWGGYFFRRPQDPMKAQNPGREGLTVMECQAPTPDNPYANVMLTDLQDRPDRPPACPGPEAAAEADARYYESLYMNVEDVYNRQANARQFYTTANTTIPNDQKGYAEFLYGNPNPTCKERGIFCTGYN
jgi:hypothetical protein